MILLFHARLPSHPTTFHTPFKNILPIGNTENTLQETEKRLSLQKKKIQLQI